MTREIYYKFKNKKFNFFNFKFILTFLLLIFSFLIFSPTKVEGGIAHMSSSSVSYSASSGNLNLITPSYPSSISAGNLLVLIIGQKPNPANTGGVVTPEGWTPITSLTGAGGYGTTLGSDTGNTNVYAYYRIATGSLSGSIPITLTSNSIAWAQIFRLVNGTGGWDLAGATGSDVTAGTAVEINFSSDPEVIANDFILGAMVIPTDVTTPSQFSAQALAQSGVTFDTVTEISEPDTYYSLDIGGFTYKAAVSSGTSAGNPTLNATAGGTTTNVRGPGIFIRIRETTVSAVPVVETGNITNIGATKAEGNGLLLDDSDGGIIEMGIVWNTAINPTISHNKAISFRGEGMNIQSQMTGLLDGTLYYARAYATNSVGTAYGDNVTFTTDSRPVTTLNTPEAYNFGADNTPPLEMTATDAEGDVVLYNVQISKNNDLLDRWVAVGKGINTIAYSDDSGSTWTGLGTSIFSTEGYAVAWNGSMWVAVGDGTNHMAYSYDGISWTGLGTSIFTYEGYGIAWNGSMWVAVGWGTNSIAYSYDGINWTGLGTSLMTDSKAVAWNGSMWVAVGDGTNNIAYSYDGINWNGLGLSIFSAYGIGIAWNGNMWVATGYGTTHTMGYSTDGINWTGLGKTIFSTSSSAVAWNGSIWVAVGSGTVNTIAYSTDGINWIGLGNSIFSSYARAIAWNGSMWVAGGSGTNTIAYSNDGISWTGLGTSIFSTDGYGIASASPTHLVPAIPYFYESSERAMAVAVGSGTNTIAYSNDGLSWTGLGTSIFSGAGYGVAWNGSMWVAVGNGTANTIAYSTDGISWTGLGKTIFSSRSYGVAWNGSMWVATGYGTANTMAYSTDGISWTGLGTSIFSSEGYGVAWNGSMWVAVGYGTANTIAYSTDGISWTGLGKTIFTGAGIGYSVAWNGSMWVATGYGTNTIAYSYDGISWTGLGTSIFLYEGYGVAWNGSMWVATGSGTNTIAYSYDGISWTGLGTSIFYYQGYGVAWNGSMWVATGYGTTHSMAHSYNGINWIGLGKTIFSTSGSGVASNPSPNLYPPILKQGTALDTGFINTVTSTDSSPFIQGQKVSYTVPAERALDNGTYYWRARALDKYGSKEYGEWSAVRSFIIEVPADLPTVTTGDIEDIGLNSATLNGEIVDRGNVINDKRGFVYDTTSRADPGNVAPDSSLYPDKIEETGVFLEGLFSANLSSLDEDTTYYVRAYSHNEAGYSYGAEVSFKTKARPVITLETADGYNFGTDATPTLRMMATEADLDEVNYHIQVHTNSSLLDRWVAVGGGTNTIAYSDDNGNTWTGLGTSIFSLNGYGVAWNGSMWVAVGQGTNTIAYSTDGISWTGIGTSIFSSVGYGVAWNGSMWIAVGYGTANTIAYSTDGITWTGLGKTIFASYGHGIAYNGSMWVAVGQGTNSIAHSTDGISWTGLGTEIFESGSSVASNGSMWVATGQAGISSIAYSNDGISWTGIDILDFIFEYSGTDVAWNGSMWVAVGSGTTNTMAYSINGITWTGLGTSIFPDGGSGVAWNGDRWVAIGDGTNHIAYSTDGITWTGLGTSIFSSYGIGIASSTPLNLTPAIPEINEKSERRRWVATGSGDNTLAYSDDGIFWTGLGKTIFTESRGVAWNGSMWVAVGSGANNIANSTDGISWTGLGNSIFSNTGNGVAWNGSMWVAVGNGTANTIAYSIDGISWTGLGTSIFSSYGNGIAWNGSIWVAVGSGANSIAYSADGINWTGLGTSIFSSYGNGIAWNGSIWVAVGNGTANTIAYSTDGISWTGLGTSIFDTWYPGRDIAWNGDMFVAVGQGSTNTIAYSFDGINWYGLGNSTLSLYGFGIASNSPVEMYPSITKQGSIDTGFTNEETITDEAPFIQGEVVNYEFPIEKELDSGTYYWRARAVDTFDSGEYSQWSSVRSFIINNPPILPIVETGIVTDVDLTTATVSAEITHRGNEQNDKRGFVYDTSSYINPGNISPEASSYSSKFEETGSFGLGSFYVDMDNLDENTTYYVRSYSHNSVGYTYGDEVSFKTISRPVITLNTNDSAVFAPADPIILEMTATDGDDDYVNYQIQVAKDNNFLERWVAVGAGTNTIAYSDDNGLTWTGLGTSIFGTSGWGIAWNGNMWIAGGEGTNSLAYSTDGITWTGLGTSIFSTAARDIAWNGNMWVAVGYGATNTLAYSTDGITWTGLGKTIFSTYGFGIDWNGNMWVATGNGTNTIAYSTDGISWTGLGTSIFSTSGWGSAWNGSMWVAFGEGINSLAYSTDGITWTGLGTSIFSGAGYGIAWNGNMWVAVGSGQSHSLAYSTDGITWTGLGKTIITLIGMSITWNGSIWVATGNGTNTIAYSTDGITWIGLGASIFSSYGRAVASSSPVTLTPSIPMINETSKKNKWVIGEVWGSGMGAYSNNGIAWNTFDFVVLDSVSGIAWNGNMWVAVGNDDNNINSVAYSYDGINWTGAGDIFNGANGAHGVDWNGNMWLAFGEGTNTIAYSYDGINWTGLGNSIFSFGRSAAWNGSMWVAVGGDGGPNTLAYSYDGINWNGLGTSVFDTYGFGVAWNGEMWLVGGAGNNIAYSYDGINWTGLGNFFGWFVYDFAWNGEIWVAVGWGGSKGILHSYDGINWVINPLDNAMESVSWNGDMFVAVGNSGVRYSYDGINWTGLGNMLGNTIRAVASDSPVHLYPSIVKQIDSGNFENTIAPSDSAPFDQAEKIKYTAETALDVGTYYWRARAIDSFGSNIYGEWSEVRSFLVSASAPPQVATSAVTNIGTTTATGNGEVIADGGATITERGIVWSTTVDPTILDNKATATGTIGVYTADLIDLISGETYYVRAYATNSAGTGYGDNVTFVTQTKPSITQDTIDGYNFGTDMTPTLEFTGTDLNDDDVGYNIEIHTDSSFVNRWVAMGQGTNSIAYSDDNGLSWTGLGTSIFSNGYGIAYNGSMWVAVGSGTNSIAYSADGINWTGLGTSIFSSGYSVAWNGSMWVAVGGGTNNTIAYSNDGTNWIGLGKSIFSTNSYSVAWNGNMWVAVGYGTNTIAHSNDGVSWTGLGTSIFSSIGWGVAWSGNMWVAVGQGTSNSLAYSINGTDWIGLGKSIFSAAGINISWNGSTWVAVGYGTNTIAYSTNGTTWTGLGASILSTIGYGIAWNGSMWLAVGQGTNTIAYSTNGTDWIGLGTSIFSTTGRGIASNTPTNLIPSYSFINKNSASDTGFLNTVNGGDLHPFNQDEKVSYTVQSAEQLYPQTYYWRVRANDPDGSNTYSEWSATRSFTIADVWQLGYRIFENDNSTEVGDPVADQNNVASLENEKFRLRTLLYTPKGLDIGKGEFKLQYAEKSGSCLESFATEGIDITNETEIAFYDNYGAEDKEALTTNAGDPTFEAKTVVGQSYIESNNFNIIDNISTDQLGLFDFSLYYKGTSHQTSFCFRVVHSDGRRLENYSFFPEIVTPIYRSRGGGASVIIEPIEEPDEPVDGGDPGGGGDPIEEPDEPDDPPVGGGGGGGGGDDLGYLNYQHYFYFNQDFLLLRNLFKNLFAFIN